MTRPTLEADIAAIEADLPPSVVTDARFECGWSGPVLMPTLYELQAYAAELRRVWHQREAERRVGIYQTQGMAAFRAEPRRRSPA